MCIWIKFNNYRITKSKQQQIASCFLSQTKHTILYKQISINQLKGEKQWNQLMTESIMPQMKGSEQSKVQEEGQIQSFEIEPRTLTNLRLQQMIHGWGVMQRIREKFVTWGFHFTVEKVINVAPQTFYKAAIHYVVLKEMQVLIKDFNESQLLIKSMELKQIYQLQSLKGKLKAQRFDYLLIVTVKLISFFLGSHIREIIISNELESKIYAILVFVLLGTQVGEKAYFMLIQKYKRKVGLKKNVSQQKIKELILPTIGQCKKISQHHNKTSKTAVHPPRNTVNRIQYRYGTQMLNYALSSNDDNKYREIKQLLRVNLKVKQFIPKPKVKQSLDTVLGKAVDVETKLGELDVAKELQIKEMKHKKIGYAQMSSSMDLKGDNHALSLLQNHSLNIKPQKLARFYQLKKKQEILLQSSKSSPNLNSLHLPKIQQPLPPQPQVYSYQAMVQKKKQPTYWKKILTEMKENHYGDTQHLPPVNTRMHFKQWQFDDQNKRETPVQDNDEKVEGEVLHQEVKERRNSYHGEYITERVVDMAANSNSDPHSSHGSHQQAHANKVVKSKQQLGHKKGLLSGKIISENVKQQPKNEQITVAEYSGIGNDGEMFKEERGFLHIYSSKPITDFDGKKKRKKTYAEIKQLERRFYKEKKIRQEKILQSQFS